MFTSILPTPIGEMVIQANNNAVYFIGFPEIVPEPSSNLLTETALQQFEEYFEGKRHIFTFQMVQPGSEFQQQVWQELITIPSGKPISYTTLSKKMNKPLAIRAIAAANGKNNLMIAVPCHRVIGSNGDLVGFSAGLWRKQWLLEHEAKMMGIGQSVIAF
ncbi:MAG: methylated-DNA--[protein]-cysteine S-methyltransferase [Daejeonella sp.]